MNKSLKYGLVILGISIFGISIYYFVRKSDHYSENSLQKQVYTCPMPQDSVFSDKPGKCQKCGMNLMKIVADKKDLEENSIEDLLKPTDNFVVGNYKTAVVKDTSLTTEINLPGVVTYDPNAAVNISARMSGRIEKMYVNYKFQRVYKGQKLFDLYSPELLTEQQNFIYMISDEMGNYASVVEASRKKLLLYGMTSNQINTLASTKKSNPVLSIYSPASGIVVGTDNMAKIAAVSMAKSASNTETLAIKEGDYIRKNQAIFKLLNTNKVWGIFNIIQGYSSLIKTNQPIKIFTELDEKDFIAARINFIETQLNPADKTNRVRVYLDNNERKLLVGLRLQGVVRTNPIKGIWIQKQALVSTGNKKVVFLKMGNGFKAKAIKTGIAIGDFVQVIDGISAGDSIAENGTYLIDSESFIKTE